MSQLIVSCVSQQLTTLSQLVERFRFLLNLVSSSDMHYYPFTLCKNKTSNVLKISNCLAKKTAVILSKYMLGITRTYTILFINIKE